MPYYLVDVTELPYPHTMESRNYDKDGQEVRSNWPSRPKERNVSSAVARDDCRELFTDTTIAQRRQACDVHAGDWTVVLPAVTASSSPSRRPQIRLRSGVAALPVWFDTSTAHPPRTTVLLQRG